MQYHKEGGLEDALKKDFNNRLDRSKTDFKSDFPFSLRLKFILQMTKAVVHIHKCNITHRDLAMRNLLLTDNRQEVVLTDFYLARGLSSARQTTKTITATVPKTSPPE